jgi:hypothetical protein
MPSFIPLELAKSLINHLSLGDIGWVNNLLGRVRLSCTGATPMLIIFQAVFVVGVQVLWCLVGRFV